MVSKGKSFERQRSGKVPIQDHKRSYGDTKQASIRYFCYWYKYKTLRRFGVLGCEFDFLLIMQWPEKCDQRARAE